MLDLQCLAACQIQPDAGLPAGACFGAGVDIITACDIRYSTSTARFCVKVHCLFRSLSANPLLVHHYCCIQAGTLTVSVTHAGG